MKSYETYEQDNRKYKITHFSVSFNYFTEIIAL